MAKQSEHSSEGNDWKSQTTQRQIWPAFGRVWWQPSLLLPVLDEPRDDLHLESRRKHKRQEFVCLFGFIISDKMGADRLSFQAQRKMMEHFKDWFWYTKNWTWVLSPPIPVSVYHWAVHSPLASGTQYRTAHLQLQESYKQGLKTSATRSLLWSDPRSSHC